MTTELFIACLSGLCALIGVLLAFILNGIASSMKEMSRNLSQLNEKMVAIVYRVDNHELRLNVMERDKIKKGERV